MWNAFSTGNLNSSQEMKAGELEVLDSYAVGINILSGIGIYQLLRCIL